MNRKIILSFVCASRGFMRVFREERNIRVHIFCMCCAILLALALNFTAVELALVLFASGVVVASELSNAALERYSDIIKPRVSGYVEHIKDIAASSVLVLAVMSVFIGLLLYIPKILMLFP